MREHVELEVRFMAEVAARLAGRQWPASALEQLTQGAGQGLVSAIDDLVIALQKLGEEDFGAVAPADGRFGRRG